MRLPALILCVPLLLTGARAARAQISPTTPPPPPQPREEAPAPPEPVFDPLHAEKSIEVGMFYMRKGKYDAAIDRFEDATHLQPSLAKPWKLMGEAYEKKHEYGHAVESYRKYLQVLPGAADASQVKKHIAELEQKAGRPAAQ